MALEHAIMISLAERPGTGYELGRQFATSLGHFWPATRQQIYRTLGRLHDDGLVTCRDVAQDGRPDKKVYALAPAGRTALQDWIAEPSELMKIRDDLSVKIRGAEHGDLDDLCADIGRHRDAHLERLRLYRSYERTQFPEVTGTTAPGTPDTLTGRRLHQHLVLRLGIRLEASFVDWCTEVLDALTHDHREGQ
ncbi:PadR family transcriptional regulator [Corynebacterium kalidii]|uniref:PadR family transcriptional regulator n=1 Tax=Corynebacterium kalidii TaxID=2931982 RepID=A0A9X1WMM7_9CORY|nr:PadR family transcriptional regulator [Corynebacterium kalidii]MCJ7859397.1 PadR family transcriptional regulator [Corynebacterium kalidii]